MTVTSVVTLDDWHRVHEGGAYVIVAYTAQWCEPSQRITDEFRRLSESRRNLHFISVDVEDAEDVSQLCGISAMPAFHVSQAFTTPCAPRRPRRPTTANARRTHASGPTACRFTNRVSSSRALSATASISLGRLLTDTMRHNSTWRPTFRIWMVVL
eukprot:scaffold97276_cov35-Tisochrysis_lutea.AAC.2